MIEDGVYDDMPMSEYLAIGRATLDEKTGEITQPTEYVISSGIVKEVYWHSLYHALQKLRGLHQDTSARQKLGSLVHTMVLERDKIAEDYVILPAADGAVFAKADGTPSKTPRNTVAYKEAVGALIAAHPDKEAVEQEQVDAALLVVAGVERCEDAKLLIDAPGRTELTVITTDPISGLKIKARYDKWLDNGWDLNLKGCRSASFYPFQKDVSAMHFIGAGFYKYAADWAGLVWQKSVILALELDPPHVVKPWECYPDVMDGGERVTRWALDKIAAAIDKDEWPAYGDRIEGMALTEYAYQRIDERTET